ncbi:glutaminase liver isoform, mitochondrial-like [Pollicipes pollicipes]|uniref:glutaminase liver isoform, mitochondrial-like n=1 Tax=Pollicipes pollicipes TaxID=41117 RepID=UPI00188525C8|nr:glutaminase liver isoform, mitochondrial-like [Pollicipes pollicipes]
MMGSRNPPEKRFQPPRSISVDEQAAETDPIPHRADSCGSVRSARPPDTRGKLKWQLSRQESILWSSLFLDSASNDKSPQSLSHQPVKMNIDIESRLQRIKQQGQNRHTLSHVEDKLCEMFRAADGTGRVNITKFLEALATVGLRQTDPRLAHIKRSILAIQASCARDTRFWSHDGLCFDEDVFKGIIMDNIAIINKALTGELVIPQFQAFCGHIDEFYQICKKDDSGTLARVDSSLWGVSLCTIDGQRYSVGDVNVPFTIQSVSKPIGYAIACADNGSDFVHKHVGLEPSGRSFNELFLDNNYKPHNPMINSGAIMVSTLIKPEMDIADRFDYAFQTCKKMVGGEYLGFNNAVFLSERQTSDRNFALAYFMRENKCFPRNIDLVSALDFYFQLCSLEVTCESAAVMAGTLANGGVCPLTGQAILDPSAVRNTLCLMHSCGMYDYSGQFAFKCGVPAKSGVSGVIIVVIPNVLGFALYSPRLDSCGNSVRGVRFCKELIKTFNFHHFDNVSASTQKIDPRRTCAEKRADVLYRVLFAAAAGDLTAIRRYCLMDVSLNAGDYDGRTALHLAAAEGHVHVVAFLLEKCGVKVNPKDRWGNVPLDDAKMGGHLEIINLLRRKYKETHGISFDESVPRPEHASAVPANTRCPARTSPDINISPTSNLALSENTTTEAKLNNLTQPKPEPELEPGTEPEPLSEPTPGEAQGPASEPERGALRSPETKSEPKVEPEQKPEPETEPETEPGEQAPIRAPPLSSNVRTVRFSDRRL